MSASIRSGGLGTTTSTAGNFYYTNSGGIGAIKRYRPKSMEEIRMLFWEFTNDWYAETLYHLRSVPRLEQVFKSIMYNLKQPKPKSRLRAKLYK